MACINNLKSGRKSVQFFDTSKQRRSISIGKVTDEEAVFFKNNIEHLVQLKESNRPVDDDTAVWLSGLDKKKTQNLVNAGLIEDQYRTDSQIRIDKATNEEKIREYMRIEAIEAKEARKRKSTNSSKRGTAAKFASRAVRMSEDRARMGKTVIEYADSLKDESEKKRIIESLNKAISPTYEMLPKNASQTKKSIDAAVRNYLYSLARKLDDRASLFGGDENRDECMILIKELDKKYNDWRASE